MAGDLIRVAIIDDHPVVAAGMAALLQAEPDIAMSGVAASIEEGHEAGFDDASRIDVLLLDLRLGERSGLDLFAADAPTQRPAVIVLTAYDYPQYAEAALRLGAAGFVLKTAPVVELLEAIRRVATGGLAFSARPRSSIVRLTRREREVVRLVVDGRTNDEVAGVLGIGSKTVETHLARIFERADIASRTELASRALREGWLEVPN